MKEFWKKFEKNYITEALCQMHTVSVFGILIQGCKGRQLQGNASSSHLVLVVLLQVSKLSTSPS